MPVSDRVHRDAASQREIRDRIEHRVDMLITNFRQARDEQTWD
jgi:hypothetical protein